MSQPIGFQIDRMNLSASSSSTNQALQSLEVQPTLSADPTRVFLNSASSLSQSNRSETTQNRNWNYLESSNYYLSLKEARLHPTKITSENFDDWVKNPL